MKTSFWKHACHCCFVILLYSTQWGRCYIRINFEWLKSDEATVWKHPDIYNLTHPAGGREVYVFQHSWWNVDFIRLCFIRELIWLNRYWLREKYGQACSRQEPRYPPATQIWDDIWVGLTSDVCSSSLPLFFVPLDWPWHWVCRSEV